MSLSTVIARSEATVAVGTLIAERPPHRSVRAAFPHTAPTSGRRRSLAVCSPAPVTRSSGSVPGTCLLTRIPLGPSPSLHQLRSGSPRLVRQLHRYYDWVRRPASVHHRLRLLTFPMRTIGPLGQWSGAGPPRFRRDPSVRDAVFDHGRASAPRIAGPHMLPSTLLTVSASAKLCLSRLNSTPHTITVYASQPSSPATTQHSLPGARYGLPAPVFHRQDRASFPGAQAIHSFFSWRDGLLRFARNDGICYPTIPAATWPRSRSRLCNVSAQASATSMPLMTKCLRKNS